MKRKRSQSPVSRSPRPSRSPRGTRASTRSPRSPLARLDLSQSTPKVDPDEESLASARRSSRGKKTLDYTESHNEESSPEVTMNGGASGLELPSRRTRSSDHVPTSSRRFSSPILTAKVNGNREVHTPPKQNGKSKGSVSEDEGHAKPRRESESFYTNNHVRFSPSAKPSSPARWGNGTRSRRKAADVARVRLQNVPSEDEQSEFNRRYSRDQRRKRRKNLRGDDDDDDEDEEERKASRRRNENISSSLYTIAADNHEVGVVTSRRSNEDLPLRRRTRNYHEHDSESDFEDKSQNKEAHRRTRNGREADHESESEVENKKLQSDKTRRCTPMRQATRNLRYHTGESSEDESMARKERFILADKKAMSKNVAPKTNGTLVDGEIEEDEAELDNSHIRRSSRILTKKALAQEQSGDEDSSESESSGETETEQEIASGRRDGRPKRKRAPVVRLTYGKPTIPRRVSQRPHAQHYSSEEEFRDKKERSSRRKKSSRNRRKSRPRPANKRDSSPTSSSDTNTDEERFVKRKKKRMLIEMSKMRPMNMGKEDLAKSIFRDRQKVGTSCADISPMEVDMKASFESVGGSADKINCLKEVVVLPLLYPEIFAKFNITPPRGVLFHGPPGTGKTLLARALAAECSQEGRKVAFFMRKGADCLNKWIGESERQLRLLFDQAYVMRPSIIFFDEIDGLAPVRSSRQDQIHSSIVSTLLALIDGLDNRGEVIVIGATNRVENIDPALRRPGRFDRELRFDLPTRDARREILTVHTKTWKPKVPIKLLDVLADKTIGYSGADLKGLCAESVLRALRRRYPQVYKTNLKLGLDTEQVVVMEDDFLNAMVAMVPSTHRVYDQHQMPLPTNIKPLLQDCVAKICQMVDQQHNHKFSYRPRILITGNPGQALSTYVGPALLHHLEKLPKHILDLPTLYSNSARSPEEKLCHIFHEARRTVPSVLYIPDLKELCMTEPIKMAFLSLLASVQPTAPLLVLAISEREENTDASELDHLVSKVFSNEETFQVLIPMEAQRKTFFEPVFEAAVLPPVKEAEAIALAVEELNVVPLPESRELTENEEKRLRKKEDALLRELRIFLRDIWHKINREQRFFMFRRPVDTQEVDDYLQVIKNPMDFDKMLSKLDNGEYSDAQSFLDDIDLIAQNALEYNGDPNYETNKIICHRARALQDFAYALVKAEMDTDFEDECKEIVARRKRLTKKLKEDPIPKTVRIDVNNDIARSGGKKKSKKRSSWSRGKIASGKNKKRVLENGISDKSLNDGSGEEDNKEHSDNEMSEEDGSLSDISEDGTLHMDTKKLAQVKAELIKSTSQATIEELERIFVRLMILVNSYKDKFDRRHLPEELKEVVVKNVTA